MAILTTGKYEVHNQPVEVVLAWLKAGEIAIPEIQRPFVWDAVKVRNLMDSLYQGYPIGYLIAWQSEKVRLKDGGSSAGRKILIDGQQRVTALAAAILGWPVVQSDYRKARIRIAFHPLEEKFEVANTAIERDAAWFADISAILHPESSPISIIHEYCARNAAAEERKVESSLQRLNLVMSKQLGIIELSHDLDIETVTEIFIRTNMMGVSLNQADFAMSKIASAEQYGGPMLRKAIDFFCHLAREPGFYETLKEVDAEFCATPYFQDMAWLRSENDDLYDPSYTDMLRVAFTSEFGRGRLADLVSLLSGRNFETHTFEEGIAEAAFATLARGIRSFMSETSFKKFVMIVRSAGFVAPWMIRSQNVLNFGYAVFLKLREMKVANPVIERCVRRWIVLSLLTGRYTGSFESQIDSDVREIASRGIETVLGETEEQQLSEAFWRLALARELEGSTTNNPHFCVFLAAQVKAKDLGFLSRDITVGDLISQAGDLHHIFPRDLLKKNGLHKGRYNQVANYAYMQTEINIRIGNKAPGDYLARLRSEFGGKRRISAIENEEQLKANLAMNCVPEGIFTMDVSSYDDFLVERRRLMARKIEEYYKAL